MRKDRRDFQIDNLRLDLRFAHSVATLMMKENKRMRMALEAAYPFVDELSAAGNRAAGRVAQKMRGALGRKTRNGKGVVAEK